MLVRSNDKPKGVEIIGNGHTVLVMFRYDIVGIEQDDFNGFEYNEISIETKNKKDLEKIILNDFKTWLGYAKKANGIDIESIVVDKTTALNMECKNGIEQGFTVDLGTGEKHFGCSIENQSNIDNLYLTAQAVMQGFELPIGSALEYNTSDDECLENLTPEQVTALWVAKNTHVYKYRKLCEQKKKAVKDELIG